jgi:acetylornithine deacetylase/succinyl-diaminopimelate desuccinylase-like protein
MHRGKTARLWALLLGIAALGSAAATPRDALIQEYCRLLALPNVGTDKAHVRENAEFIAGMMRARGIDATLLEGDTADTNPVVYGEANVPGATRTVVFYAHYDGQPVNPARWAAGLEPFTPTLITAPVEQGGTIVGPCLGTAITSPTWRIAARGAADDKAGVMTILNAYAALREAGRRPRVNLHFFFEGEEEQGSVHLAEILAKHRARLGSDLWVVVDGPRPAPGYKVVEFGVRGDINVGLVVFGAKRPLHSGNYGNWAPNPALRLATLLAGMKDGADHVTIPGFYDDVVPLSDSERAALEKVPDPGAQLALELGIAHPDGGGRPFAELLTLPTLNINGIRSGDVGAAASNQIPTRAEAVLDLRLAKGNTAAGQVQKLVRYIESQGYHVLDRDPTDAERRRYERLIRVDVGAGYDAQRTSMDLPIARAVVTAVQTTTPEPVVKVVSVGGSLPLIVFERVLGANVVTVPVVNYDNNQHAENENVRIDFLWDAIDTIAAVMSIR